MSASAPPTDANPNRPRGLLVGACLLVALACIIGGLLPVASLRLVLIEGWPAALLGLAGIGLGRVLLRLLGLSDLPPRWDVILGGGIGLGLLSLLVLAAGLAGCLNRTAYLISLALFATLGAGRVIAVFRPQPLPSPLEPDDAYARPAYDRHWRWLWLTVIPFAALAILAASFPAGILWPEEGNGYDVLEYHFGAPRDYYYAGRISYLPNNIYSNFPFNVEMLYLAAFVLRGGPVAGVFAAQCVNLLLAAGAVAAGWLAGRTLGRAAGHLCGVLVAICPFLAWLCGVAYVENGLLLFTALALAALLAAWRPTIEDGPPRPVRKHILAGLAAGLACGCKYTAFAMVLAPLVVAAFAAPALRDRRWTGPIAFTLAALLAVAPWLIKNAVYTHNPVFPLARSVFPERNDIWTEDGAARWHAGHLPDPAFRTPGGLFARATTEIAWNPLFGALPALWVLAMLSWPLPIVWGTRHRLLGNQSRSETPSARGSQLPHTVLILSLWLTLATLAVWLFATHLYGRFAVTLILPLALAIAAFAARAGRQFQPVVAALAVLLAGFHLSKTIAVFNQSHVFDFVAAAQRDNGAFDPHDLLTLIRNGDWPGMTHLPRLNTLLAAGNRILVVADARPFYLLPGADYWVVFNRNLFATAVHRRRRPADLFDWLREQGYSYIYVDWSEMRRLRGSRYGFWKGVDEALFERLESAGLEPREQFRFNENTRPYATLYRIPIAR